jgi:uroporphyrinogen decarboxylase
MTEKANQGLEKPLLRVLKGECVQPRPIWLMRQAGRYLPEYRALRKQAGSFLDLCYTPELAAEITLQPIRRYGFDAAILFSDILVLPDALGQTVRFEEGIGPKLDPVTADNLAAVCRPEAVLGGGNEKLEAVYEAIRLIRRELPAETALIGFCGAPWTVATYMVEGGGSKTFERIRRWAAADSAGFAQLIDILVDTTVAHLLGQIAAGVEAVQLFESHAGVLDTVGFARWVLEPARRIVTALHAAAPDVPVIGFPRGGGVQLPRYASETGIDALGLDQSIPLDWIDGLLPKNFPVQGNLDPIYLLDGSAEIARHVEAICEALPERPHIFNLGHGVIKETDPETIQTLVECLRSL